MVYSTFENYDLGQLGTRPLPREENSVNHLNDRYYKVKSHSGQENKMILLSRKYVSAVIEYNCRVIN
jgi:hypothetical protein